MKKIVQIGGAAGAVWSTAPNHDMFHLPGDPVVPSGDSYVGLEGPVVPSEKVLGSLGFAAGPSTKWMGRKLIHWGAGSSRGRR